jgi:hypothetical protein
MNRGAEELRKCVTVHGSKVALARQVGVEPYQLSHFLKGVRKPNYEQRAWFEDNLKIGWRLWDIEVAEPKLVKVKRATVTAKPVRKASHNGKMTTRGAA